MRTEEKEHRRLEHIERRLSKGLTRIRLQLAALRHQGGADDDSEVSTTLPK